MKLLEAIEDYRKTKNEDVLYEAVVRTGMKLSECAYVLEDTLKERYSKRKLYDIADDIISEELNNAPFVEGYSSNFEE